MSNSKRHLQQENESKEIYIKCSDLDVSLNHRQILKSLHSKAPLEYSLLKYTKFHTYR